MKQAVAAAPRVQLPTLAAHGHLQGPASLLSKHALQYMHAALGAQLGHRSPAAQVWRPSGCCMVGWRAERAGLGFLRAAWGRFAAGRALQLTAGPRALPARSLCARCARQGQEGGRAAALRRHAPPRISRRVR